LSKLRTLQEQAELTGSGPFGMKAPSQQSRLWYDRTATSGRSEINKDGKTMGIYQSTPSGVYLWTEKTRSQKLREADTSFGFVPLLKSGIIGLLALQTTTDTLTFVEKGEIKGKKGAMIIRTQNTPQETLLIAGKGGLSRALSQTTWAYVFAPDGTLIAERITQKHDNKTTDTQMSYDRFGTFDGIKVPTEIGVRNDQMPRMVSVKLKVQQVTVNAPIAKSVFQMP
jgi:ABC-type antimicrobial peptide transport system permease subunit